MRECRPAMKMRHAILPVLAVILVRSVSAFEACDEIEKDPIGFVNDIRSEVLLRTPIQYFDQANQVQLNYDSAVGIIPYSKEIKGVKTISFSYFLGKAVCEMSIAWYISQTNSFDKFFEAVTKEAAGCPAKGHSRSECILRHAHSLSFVFREAYKVLPENDKRIAFFFFKRAMYELIMHEYSHFFLDHLNRIRKKEMRRIDAEVEADNFAIFNGLESGDPSSTLNSFYHGLARFEHYAPLADSSEYKSISCREMNVDNVTKFVGLAPMILLSTVSRGEFGLNSKVTLEWVNEYKLRTFGKGPPDINDEGCGNMPKTNLPGAYEEIRKLYNRISGHAEVLLKKKKPFNGSQAKKLVEDLNFMISDFNFMNRLAAKSLAIFIIYRDMNNEDLSPVYGIIDGLLASPSKKTYFHSQDLGLLYHARANSILHNHSKSKDSDRYERAYPLLQKTVLYNPYVSSAYSQLAMLTFKKGDCKTAAQYALRSKETISEESNLTFESGLNTKGNLDVFILRMKEYSQSNTCAQEAKDFWPYSE